MKKLEILFGTLRVPMDALAVLLALVVSYRLRQANMDLIPGVQLLEAPTTLPAFAEYFSTFIVPSIAIYLAGSAFHNLYAFRGTQSGWREFGQICLAVATWLVVVTIWYFFVRKELFYSRILLLHAVVLMTVCVVGLRALLTIAYRGLLRAGFGVRQVVTIGRRLPPGVLEPLLSEPSYRFVAHASSFAEVVHLAKSGAVDLVIETCPDPDREDTLQLIDFCRSRHVEYAFLPPVFTESPHLLAIDRLGLLPLIRFQPTPLDGWGRVGKAAMDMLGAALALILLSPLLLFIALLILLTSGWPILYVSRRVGQHGTTLVPVLKFRTMIKEADAIKPALAAQNHRQDGPLFKIHNDPRVTPLGHFLRRWSLDELPQLFNVLVGQMSLVGPRPHLPEEVSRYSPRERRVFAVKPGITGLAQVSGRSDLSFADEVRLDLQYIEEWSWTTDLWICWRTLVVILGRKGAD